MSDSISRKLAALRRDYITKLPDRLSDVRASWLRLAQSDGKENGKRELIRAFHSLSGSGGSFGCESLSIAAKRLEDFIDVVDLARLSKSDIHHFDALFTALERASHQCAEMLAVQAPVPPPVGSQTPSERPLIYVLEDDSDFAATLSAQLQYSGFNVEVFADGDSMFQELSASPPPAALVIDMVLNEKRHEGAEVLQKLRKELGLDLPAIFLTVQDSMEDRLVAARAGSTHFFTKPIDPQRLVSLLNSHLRSQGTDAYRVLLVDDDAELASYYREWLEAQGVRLRCVNEPGETLQALKELDPELVLMDLHMPGISGLELAAVIRQNDEFSQVPIVFLSVESARHLQWQAIEAGGDDFLSKPISPERLISAILPRARRFRQLRDALERSRNTLHEFQQYKAALDEHAIVSVADVAGRILYANPKFCEVSGYSLDELLGQNHRLINSGQHPVNFFEEMWGAISSGKVWRGEICNRRKDGHLYWVESTIVPQLDERGRPFQYISIRTEITGIMQTEQRLRDSEEHLSHAQRVAQIGHYDYDLRTNRLVWSDTTYGLIGLIPGRVNPSFEYFLTVIHPDDVERVRVQMQSAMLNEHAADTDGRVQLPSQDYRVVHPDGEERWMHSQAIAELGPDRRPQRVRGTVQDITERKRFEQELVRAREQAEAASHAKTQFLTSMSHELRTPLNAILGFAQLMELDPNGALTPQQKDNNAQILAAGWHLLTLINDVLDLSKIESGALVTQREAVELVAVIDECLETMRPLAMKSQADLQVFENTGARIGVWGDRVRIKQVLLNLLSNAIKYNRPGGKVVLQAVQHGDRVRVTVQDQGQGLGEAQKQKLFESFNRLGREAEQIEGTGIGLVITKRLVEMMGGSVGVESQPGQGSTFWVEFESTGSSFSMPARPQGVGPAVGTDEAFRVLYIEDNATNVRLVEKIIGQLPGVSMLMAFNGQDGIIRAHDERPELVLLDMNLPDMHGMEVLSALRHDPDTRSIPVIAVSADATPREIDRALAGGVLRYFTKPLNIAELSQQLKALQKSRAP